MSAWTRCKRPEGVRCGGCGAEIPFRDPLKELTFGRATLYRCASCAGPAPPDLPEEIVLTGPRPRIDLSRFGLLPLDYHGGEE